MCLTDIFLPIEQMDTQNKGTLLRVQNSSSFFLSVHSDARMWWRGVQKQQQHETRDLLHLQIAEDLQGPDDSSVAQRQCDFFWPSLEWTDLCHAACCDFSTGVGRQDDSFS